MYRSTYRDSGLVRTKLDWNTLNAAMQARRFEKRIKRSKQTRRESTAPVTLAGQAASETRESEYQPPVFPPRVKVADLIAKIMLLRENQGRYTLVGYSVAHWLLREGLIHENPRRPDSGEYHIAKAGLQWCEWLCKRKDA
jgi:hypothetical protein